MAIKSTVFKVFLSISDVVRNYYEDHALTVAQHPSETDLRMILRFVAFALNAHERLELTKGLASAEEPDLWQKSLTGEIEHWIELGQPTEKRLRQSCSKANLVTVYTYQKGAANLWYEGIKNDVERFRHLRIVQLTVADESRVAALVDRSMRLNCLIEDDSVLLSNDTESLSIRYEILKPSR